MSRAALNDGVAPASERDRRFVQSRARATYDRLLAAAAELFAEKGFDDSRLFAAYLNTLKWNCVTLPTSRLL